METFNHPINTGEHECNNIPVFNNVRENNTKPNNKPKQDGNTNRTNK